MTVEQFATYVVDNIDRATCANALNISNRFFGQNSYSFDVFLKNVCKTVEGHLRENKIDKATALQMLGACGIALKRLGSDKRYDFRMVVDDFVLSLWQAVNTR